MNKKSTLITSLVLLFTSFAQAQSGYWQQRVEYTMNIKMNVATHQFDGDQN